MTAATLGLLGLLLVIVLLTHEQAAAERRQAEIANAVDTGNAIAGMIDEFARNLETSALALSISIANGGPINQASTGPALSAISKEVGVLRGLFVTDTAGKVVASASGDGLGLDLSGRPYMQTLRGGAPSVWAPGVAGIQSGDVTATYGLAVRATDGSLRGYLVAAFYPTNLATRFEGRIPSDGNVTIIDSHGFALYSSQYPDLSAAQRDLTARPEVQAGLRGVTTRMEDTPGLFDGAPRFGVVVPAREAGWVIRFSRRVAVLDGQLQRQLLIQVGEVTAAVLAVGGLMILSTRRIARPLLQLAETAGAVARGDRAPITPAGGGREVRDLAAAIQVMSDAVGAREQSLEREIARRQILAETSAAFAAAGLDLQGELQTIARLVSTHVGEGCNIFLLSEDRAWVEPAAIYHPAPGIASLTSDWLAAAPVPVGEALAGRVASTGTPLALADVVEEGQALAGEARIEHFRRIGMRAFVAVRIAARGNTIGVLTAWRSTPTPYSPDEVTLLQEIADAAGVNIENAQLIEDVRENVAAAERAVKLQGEFAAQVAHDLLNPLSAIKAVAQSTLRQLDRGRTIDPEKLRSDMRAIDAAVTKAANEVSTSLEIARSHAADLPALELAPADLVEVAEEAVEQTRRISARHKIVLEADQDFIVGEWDRGRVLHVLENVLGNAVKYSPAGGTVTLSLRAEKRDPLDWAVIDVRDEGIGIPRDALPHIFDRFYRAANAVDIGGTGLGLSGVQQIVQAHGGSVHVDSTEGQGSVFTICLPLSPAQAILDGAGRDGGAVTSADRAE